MKKLLLLFILSILFYNAFGQYKEKIYHTIDVLYLNDSTLCHINKSPLSCFNKYDSVYSEFGYCVTTSHVPAHEDKNYVARWIICNDKLFLFDIASYCYSSGKIFPRENMERFLNTKFSKDKSIKGKSSLVSEHGVIPASWFTDTLYVKRISRTEFDPKFSYAAYDYILIFYKGRLVKVKREKNKPKKSL